MTNFNQATNVSELSFNDMDRVSGGNPGLAVGVLIGVGTNLLYDELKSAGAFKSINPMKLAQQAIKQ